MKATMGLAVVVVAALAVLATCSAADRDLADPAALAGWIAAHPAQAGIAVAVDGEPGVASSADRRFPLASTRKVLLLGGYAEAVADRNLDPEEPVPLAEVERWYWPGTDGGAHPHAFQDWKARGAIRGAGDQMTVPLDEVVWAMIRWSDNAATDYLLARVGADQALAFARHHGMDGQEPLSSIFGEFVAWATHSVDDWLGRSPAERRAEADRLAGATSVAEASRLILPPVEDQRALAGASTGGTPSDWATLMSRLAAGEDIRPAAAEVIRRHLEWPLVAFPENRERFARFGFKGGSLAGVRTNAAYLQPHGGRAVAVALFFHDAPPPVEAALEQFADQDLVVALADNSFRDQVRARFNGG